MGEIGATKGQAVVLVHGMFLSPKWMWPLARDLKRAGYGPIWNLGYGRGPNLTTICAKLGAELEELRAGHNKGKGFDGPVHGVGMSMGGLILRRLYADGHFPDRDDSHFVTLGTPHHGAARAAWGCTARPRYARFVYGPTVFELMPDSDFITNLPQLPLDKLSCVYSGRGDDIGRTKLLPGDDDGTVETSSTCVPGSEPVFVPDVHHYWLSINPRTRKAAVDALIRATGAPAPALASAAELARG